MILFPVHLLLAIAACIVIPFAAVVLWLGGL